MRPTSFYFVVAVLVLCSSLLCFTVSGSNSAFVPPPVTDCTFAGYNLTSLSVAPLRWSLPGSGDDGYFYYLQLCKGLTGPDADLCAGHGVACQHWSGYPGVQVTLATLTAPVVTVTPHGLNLTINRTGEPCASFGNRSLVVSVQCDHHSTTPVFTRAEEIAVCQYHYSINSSDACHANEETFSQSAAIGVVVVLSCLILLVAGGEVGFCVR